MLSQITDSLLLCQLASCQENFDLWPQTTWFPLVSQMYVIHYKSGQKKSAYNMSYCGGGVDRGFGEYVRDD